MNTDEIMKPDFEEDTGKCHWWSSKRHCWHEVVCSCETAKGECLHRVCCNCDRSEWTQLTAAGHGPYLPDKKNQTLIWNGWRKRVVYCGSYY